MRDDLMNKIDGHMHAFFAMVEPQFHLPPGSLWQKWNENQKASPVPEKIKNMKKSNYQVFFSIQRDLIITKHPDMSFGEISKQVSAMWKKMSIEEKAQYACASIMPKKQSAPKKLRPRTEASMAASSLDDTSSVQIVQATKKSARSKLELIAEDEKEEDMEEDFFFEEENSESEEASHASDDIEDLGEIDDGDESMYVDDD